MVCDLLSNFHAFVNKLLIQLTYNLVDELIMGRHRPDGPYQDVLTSGHKAESKLRFALTL